MKKRIIPVFLAAVLLFTGCSSSDYKKAQQMYDSGDYAGALEIYKNLSDYKDSPDYVTKCEIRLSGVSANTANEIAEKAYYQALAYYIVCSGYIKTGWHHISISGSSGNNIKTDGEHLEDALKGLDTDKNGYLAVHIGDDSKPDRVYWCYKNIFDDIDPDSITDSLIQDYIIGVYSE